MSQSERKKWRIIVDLLEPQKLITLVDTLIEK